MHSVSESEEGSRSHSESEQEENGASHDEDGRRDNYKHSKVRSRFDDASDHESETMSVHHPEEDDNE